METEYLKQLLLMEEFDTFSKAAEYAHFSQPTLTRNMQKLEQMIGVELFEHKGNRITMNAIGRKACDYARMILQLEDDMIENCQRIDRSEHAIHIGSCAPLPLSELLSEMTVHFVDCSITGEIRSIPELINGLENGTYTVIILPYPIKEIPKRKIFKESLLLSVNRSNQYAQRTSIHLEELDGEMFLLNKNIGIWADLVQEKMPNSRYLIQADAASVDVIASRSDLFTFTTDQAMKRTGKRKNHVTIPICDKEASITFYAMSQDPSFLIRSE